MGKGGGEEEEAEQAPPKVCLKTMAWLWAHLKAASLTRGQDLQTPGTET